MSIYVRDFEDIAGSALANEAHPHRILPGNFASLRNVRIENGTLAKRPGTKWQATSSEALAVLKIKFGYNQATSIVNRLVACGTKVQYLSGTTLTDVVDHPAMTTGLFPQIEFYGNVFYYSNGTNTQRQISNGAIPTSTAWTLSGLPGAFIPTAMTVHKDRLYVIDDDDLYMSSFGNPLTYDVTEAYKIPGDKSGRYVTTIKSFGDWIGLFAGDYWLSMKGTGIFSHRIQHMPKGPPLIAPRGVIDYNGLAIVITTEGLLRWDGTSPARNLDPENKIDWTNMNFKTRNATFLTRDEDHVYLFFQSKGSLNVGSSTVAMPPRGSFMTVYAAWSRLRKVSRSVAPADPPTNVQHYYAINMKNGKVTGPHDGMFSCAEWEDWNLNDEHNLWVGSSQADGKLYKMNQGDVWVDQYGDTSVNSGAGLTYPCEIITGGLHGVGAEGESSMDSCSVDLIRLKCSSQPAPSGVLEVQVVYNEQVDRPAVPSGPAFKIPLGQKGPRGGDRARGEEKTFDRGEIVQHDIVVNNDRTTKNSGWDPQLIMKYEGDQPLQIRELQVLTNSGKG